MFQSVIPHELEQAIYFIRLCLRCFAKGQLPQAFSGYLTGSRRKLPALAIFAIHPQYCGMFQSVIPHKLEQAIYFIRLCLRCFAKGQLPQAFSGYLTGSRKKLPSLAVFAIHPQYCSMFQSVIPHQFYRNNIKLCFQYRLINSNDIE